MSFEQFIAEIRRLVGDDASDQDTWRPYYNCGYEPEAAVYEEYTYKRAHKPQHNGRMSI